MHKLNRLFTFIRKHFKTLLHLAGWTTAAVTVLGFLGRGLWVFDLLGHFRVQYFMLLIFIAIIMFFRAWFKSAFVYALFAQMNLLVLLPLYGPTPVEAAATEKTYRAMFLNVLSTNNNLNQVVAYLEENNPDFIVLAEVTPKWEQAIDELSQTWPHTEYRLHERFQGVALLSRYPLRKSEVFRFKGDDMPIVMGEVELEGHPVTLLGIHPFSPTTPERFRLRNRQFTSITDYLKKITGAKMVIGDFNITPWATPFSNFAEEAELTNTANGFGFLPTWPARMPQIPIDHCLLSSELKTVNHRIGKPLGSDHLPLIIDFSFNNL